MLVASLAQWWSWGLVTPLIHWIDRRLPFKEDQLGKGIVAHLPVSVVLTIVDSQMKLQIKREALQTLNRQANELGRGFDTVCSRDNGLEKSMNAEVF